MDINTIKQIDILDYYGQIVNTLYFDTPIDLIPRNIVVEDFSVTHVEEEVDGLIVSLQFENKKDEYDNYDVESRSNELIECIKLATEDLDSAQEINEDIIYTTVFDAIQQILSPHEKFEEFDY